MNTLRGDRVDTVGSTVLQWIVRRCIQCTVSSTGDVANRGSMRADNIHGTWIFPQNAVNIHGTWIFPQNADTQNTVESSSFGSEFIALRIATEMIEELRYKLSMLGVPIDVPADVFCDNQSVVTNVIIPSYVLNKKKILFVITGFEMSIQLVRCELNGYQASIIKLIFVRRQQYL